MYYREPSVPYLIYDDESLEDVLTLAKDGEILLHFQINDRQVDSSGGYDDPICVDDYKTKN